MKNSLIVNVSLKIIVSILNIVSLLLLLRGHNLPGGGFVGGLVLSASYGLMLLCFGHEKMLKWIFLSPASWIALGLSVALGSGFVGLLRGGDFFQGVWPNVEFPLFGKPGTPVTFDLGVYWTVFGVCTLIFTSLFMQGEKK